MVESTYAHTQVKVVVPEEQMMLHLLGTEDELLRVVEDSFDSDIHVRGNEITISGRPEDNALVVRLIEDLLRFVENGTQITPDTIERVLAMPAPGPERPPTC